MEFSEVIKKRHSVRVYTEEPISHDILDTLVDMAGTAPSSKNSRSTAFMIVEDKDKLLALSEARNRGSSFIKNAAAVIVVMGDTSKSDLWIENASISSAFLQLSATAMDLGSCWVHIHNRLRVKNDPQSGYAGDYVREILGIKENFRVLCLVSLGYEAR